MKEIKFKKRNEVGKAALEQDASEEVKGWDTKETANKRYWQRISERA